MEYTLKPAGRVSLNTQELWRYRELFYFFTWRDVKVKYKQTALGLLWVVLQPLLLMAVFTIFFARGLKIPTDGTPPALFYYSGLLFWNLFSAGLIGSANSMVDNAQIIKKVYFPRLVIPFSSILAALFDFCIAFVLFVGLIVGFHWMQPDFSVHYGRFALFLPMALLLTVGTTVGLGCALAALNVQYRDVRYLIPFATQFLLFLTPVIYPLGMLQSMPWTRYVLALNPMTGALALVRSIFTVAPPDWTVVGIGVLSMTFLGVIGLYTFRKMEAYFADIA